MDGVSPHPDGTRTPDGYPAETGIWVFVLGEMCIFSLLFFSFCHDFAASREPFLQGQGTLDRALGVGYTLLLLIGSLCVVVALHVARSGASRTVPRLYLAAAGTGILFAALKLMEYSAKVPQGFTPVSTPFFTYYYLLTGLHMAHVLVGVGVLLYLYRRSRRAHYGASDIKVFENGGVVWHMVDSLWLIIFPLLYLIH